MRTVAGAVALLYAVLVVATNLGHLTGGLGTLLYVTAVVVAPIAVLVADNLVRRGDPRGDPIAQTGLGLLFGMWALPATSGLVALLAIIAGLRAAITSNHRRVAISWLAVGVLVGVLLLGISFTRP